MVDSNTYFQIKKEIGDAVTLIAVSKTKPAEDIQQLYQLGQRDFGENYVQELVDKSTALPKDIRWHFIGHLQSNKVKYLAPFVHMIQGVDSHKLLIEIEKQASKYNRIVNCLLQVHIAQEETKFGFGEEELKEMTEALLKCRALNSLSHVKVCGLMGMASFTKDEKQVRKEFIYLRSLFDVTKAALNDPAFNTISMGMSGDYLMAIEEGSSMVRIGSLLFGARS